MNNNSKKLYTLILGLVITITITFLITQNNEPNYGFKHITFIQSD